MGFKLGGIEMLGGRAAHNCGVMVNNVEKL